MQKTLLAAFGAAALFAVPAFAATTPSTDTTSPATGSSATTQGAPDNIHLRQKITADLEKDGFKNVEVVADSFLVHAINKEGEPVVMIINPDSVFAVTKLTSAENTAPKSTTPDASKTTKQ
jgi:hypothetical protein